MRPEYPNFKALDIGDRDLLSERLMSHGAGPCELNFVIQYIWKDFDRPKYTFINDNLCILIDPLNEAPFFLEPIGTNAIGETVSKCIEHAGRVSRASASFVKSLPGGRFNIDEIRDHYDYVYRTSDLAELKGRRYDGKRNQIKKLQRSHPKYEFVAMDSGRKDDALKLFDKWFKYKRNTPKGRALPHMAFGCQRAALVNAFDCFDELDIVGGALMIDGDLKGYIMGSALNRDIACIHFFYAQPNIKGIHTALMWEGMRNSFADFGFVNLEQDLGLEGLRKFKNSYHPDRMVKKYNIETEKR